MVCRETYVRLYTDKVLRVKKNTLTTKKFQRILKTMSNQRANTVVVIFLIILGIFRIGVESMYKGLLALFTGKVIPLRNVRPLRLWHW